MIGAQASYHGHYPTFTLRATNRREVRCDRCAHIVPATRAGMSAHVDRHLGALPHPTTRLTDED